MHNQFADRINLIVITLVITFFSAVSGGTILWLIWENSLIAMFPKIVSAGIISPTLEWWPAVKIVWIFGILIKTVIDVRPKTRQPKKPVANP